MKHTIRWIALLLAVLMLPAYLLSCGEETPSQNSSGAVSQASEDTSSGGSSAETDLPAVPDDLKFEDTEIRFIVSNGDEATGSLPARSITVDEDADMSFNVNKAVAQRNKIVEDRLGVTITLKDVAEQGQLTEKLQPILLAGSDEYDVVGGYQYYDIGLTLDSCAGTFLNFNKIPDDENYIDVTKPYWDENMFHELSYKGAAYWVTGDLSQTWVGSIFVSFVNERIWKLYSEQIKELTGYSDIYDVVNNNKWTLDLWSKLSQAVWIDENSNEKVDIEDQVGFLSYSPGICNIMADGLVAGSHITYTEWVDGLPTVSFYNERSISFAEKLYDLYFQSSACTVGWSDDRYILDMFADGKALMTVNLLHNTEMYLADMTDNYYVVPVPAMDEAQGGYFTTNHDNVTTFGIPASTPNVAAVTATLEMMAYQSYKLVTPEYYDVALKNRYTRDEKAAGMIDTIRDSLYSDFVVSWTGQLGSPTHFFRNNITKRFASQAKSQAKKWQSTLNKLLDKIENSVYIEA